MTWRARVIAIGASTGGTEALHRVLSGMPVDVPGILIAQHIPGVFSARLAERLDRNCSIEVKEARDGDDVRRGVALVAPGGFQMRLTRSGGRLGVSVEAEPPVNHHCPSVDVLFESCAYNLPRHSVGIILTGMGHDGARGLYEMRRAGGRTLAQDEASSVIFGMPRAAIERGAVEEVAPLSEITDVAIRMARGL